MNQHVTGLWLRYRTILDLDGALAARARGGVPADSAAKMAVAEVPTEPFAVLSIDDD